MDNSQQNQQNQQNNLQDLLPFPFQPDFLDFRGAPPFGNFVPNFGNMAGNYPIRPNAMVAGNQGDWYHRLVYLGMQTMAQACSLGVHILNHSPYNNAPIFPAILPADYAPPQPVFNPEGHEAQIVELERNIVSMPSAIDMRNPPANASNSDVSVGSMEVFPSTSTGSGFVPPPTATNSVTTENRSGQGSQGNHGQQIRRNDNPFSEIDKNESSSAPKANVKKTAPIRACRAQSLAPIVEDDDEDQESSASAESDPPPPKLRKEMLVQKSRGGRGRGRGRGKRGRR